MAICESYQQVHVAAYRHLTRHLARPCMTPLHMAPCRPPQGPAPGLYKPLYPSPSGPLLLFFFILTFSGFSFIKRLETYSLPCIAQRGGWRVWGLFGGATWDNF